LLKKEENVERERGGDGAVTCWKGRGVARRVLVDK